MTRVHVIDDNEIIRDHLFHALTRRFPTCADGIKVESWESAKEAAEGIQEGTSRAPQANEIAICDLFDIDHYVAPEEFVYPSVHSLPLHPENVKRASLDNIYRFFPVLVEGKVRIVVFSFVFELLRSKGDEEGALAITQALLKARVRQADILEKPEKKVTPDHLQPVANHVAEIIEAG